MKETPPPARKFRVLRRVAKILFWPTLLLVLWLVGVAIHIVRFGEQDHARPAGAIIVLGAAAYHTKPSPVFEQRLRHAVELYRKGLAPKLILTGGFGPGADFAESEVGARFVKALGIPEADLLLEKRSKTTHENLVEAKALMAEHGIADAVIVSDPLHLRRAASIASQLELDTVTSPTTTTRYRSARSRGEFLARELVFLHHQWLFGS